MTLDGFLQELETSPGESVFEGTISEAVRGLYIGEVGQDCLLHRQLWEISNKWLPCGKFSMGVGQTL